METKSQAEKPALKMDPKLRRTAMINSGILALQFGMLALASMKAGATFFAIVGLLATVGTINDTLTFYYANKEK